MSGSTPIPHSLIDVIYSANTDCKVKICEIKSVAVQLQVYWPCIGQGQFTDHLSTKLMSSP